MTVGMGMPCAACVIACARPARPIDRISCRPTEVAARQALADAIAEELWSPVAGHG